MKHSEKNRETWEKLYKLQEDYNQHTNITRINSKEDYYLKHIEDSLKILEYIQAEKSIIDVGTGGGYPGLPMAIERPDLKITLNDSAQKKIHYLNEVKNSLKLENIVTLWGRAELVGRDPLYREKYDLAIARALAEMPVLLEYLSPLVRVGGRIFIMKAKNYQEELNNATNAEAVLRLKLIDVKKYSLEGMDRALIVYEKNSATPLAYPRKPGLPEKQPIK